MEPTPVQQTTGPFRFVARRNNSLSLNGRILVFGSLAAVMLLFSVGFALAGAWPIMGFAGLELALVYLAFRHIDQQATDYEALVLQEDKLIVRIRRKRVDRCVEFNPYWVQVLGGASRGEKDGALILRSHGKEIAFGRHLTGAQRAALAQRLKKSLHAWRQPRNAGIPY